MKAETQTQAEIITRIAEETQSSEEEVKRDYMAAWQELSADARVLDYVPLFAARRVTTKLRKHRH